MSPELGVEGKQVFQAGLEVNRRGSYVGLSGSMCLRCCAEGVGCQHPAHER
jgi:hypothetical protein